MLLKQDFYFHSISAVRRLHIRIPDHGEPPYPVMYFFDGHNLFRDEDATYGKSWGLADYLDRTHTGLIVVGLECNHEGNMRLVDFCPYSLPGPNRKRIPGTGQELMQWMVDELKPMIDAEFRTLPDREHTGIGGSSMGGLMAYYSVIRHNDVFSKAACLSSASTSAGWQCPRLMTPMPLRKSRYSLPSSSQRRMPSPRTNSTGLRPNVCMT